jgi:hypothetical protein
MFYIIVELATFVLTHRSILQSELYSGMTIPLFTKALRQNNIPRECSQCQRSLYDINFESVEHWEESCHGYEGPWMDQVLLFPRKKLLNCYHDVTVCKGCYKKHITAQRRQEDNGGNATFSCPECDRVLQHGELQNLRIFFGEDRTET